MARIPIAKVQDKIKASIDRLTAIELGAVTLAWAFFAMRILRSGVGFDDVAYSTPAQQITLDAWQDGRLALWSTTTFGGTPHLGNAQLGGLYPLQWLAAPFSDLLGTDIELVFHVLIFGVGFFCLGRRLKLARPAPLAMAIAAMWSGSMIIRSTLIVHLPPLVWMPWAAICVHWVITSERPRRATALLAVVIWLTITAGHPQSILMTATFLLAWAIGLLVESREWRRAAHLAAASALAAIAAAPLLFATRASIDASASSVRDEAALLPPLHVMPLRDFPRLLLGEPMSGLINMLGQGERITYAGAAVIALGIVGAITAFRTRRWSLVALVAVGAFTASLSFGLRSPTLRFARAFLPGFDQPRVSTRWNWVLVMVLIILAGVGIDRLRQRRAVAEGLTVVGVALCFALSTSGAVNHGGWKNNLFWCAIAAMVVIIAMVAHRTIRLAAATTLAILAVFELAIPINWLIEWRGDIVTSTDELTGPGELWLAEQPGLTLTLTNEIFEPHWVVESMRPNANSIVGVRSIDGYDGGTAISRRWHAGLLQIIPTINDLIFRAQLPHPVDEAAMARLGVHYLMWDPDRGPAAELLPGWKLVPVEAGHFEIYENTLWKGDAVVWYETTRVASPEAAGNTLREDEGELDEVGIVEAAAAMLTCTSKCTADGFVTSSDYPGQRSVDIVASRDAVVAIHEQFDDGWKVFVDGDEQALVAVDGIWVGVEVTAGEHHIELRYEPGWLWPSILLMMLGWLAIASLLLWPERSLPPAEAD